MKGKLLRPITLLAHFIHAVIAEVFSLFMASVCYLINLEKRNPKVAKVTDKRPILLVHGLYHNSSGWWMFKKRLKTAHIGPVFTINLGNPFSSISEHAEKVKKMVAEIQAITKRKDIVLIGHSMGGLVATKFALDLATEDTKVTDVITIGTPLKGSKMAKYLGFGKSVKEMHVQSLFIKDLNHSMIEQKKINFFHIASKMDVLVSLSSALFPENKKAKHLVIPNLGHIGQLYSKSVINPIIDYYKNRPDFLW